MSRECDVNLIANQIVESSNCREMAGRETVRRHFERLTHGLAEYERQQVAWLVNFRLAAPVL